MSNLLVLCILLALPPLMVIALRLSRYPSLGRLAHYGLFSVAGLAHGYLVWIAFLASEWRAHHTWLDAVVTLPRGGLRMSAFFVVGYLVVALVFDAIYRLKIGSNTGR